MSNELPKNAAREVSIDRLRGLCIFIMVGSVLLGMFGDTFMAIGGLFQHGDKGWQVVPGNANFVNGGYSGIAFADVFAPLFIFVIGLTYCDSFRSRSQKFGAKKAYFQMAVRYLALIGFGAAVDGCEMLLDVFDGKWAEMSAGDRVFSVAAIALLLTLILLGISLFVKNDKFKRVASATFRYTTAVIGVFTLFVAIASLGERIGAAFGTNTLYEGSVFGGNVWDTLPNIGLAGLLALPFASFDKWGRLTVVAVGWTALTILYQFNGFAIGEWMLEGGIVGGIGWCGILLMGSVLRDFKRDGNKAWFWAMSGGMIIVSVILITLCGFVASKRGGTPVYCMFCTGVGGLLWGVIALLDNWQPKFAFFRWWGGSCFLTYVLTLVFGFAMEAAMGNGTPVWLALIIGVAWYAVMSVMNWLLARFDKHIRM